MAIQETVYDILQAGSLTAAAFEKVSNLLHTILKTVITPPPGCSVSFAVDHRSLPRIQLKAPLEEQFYNPQGMKDIARIGLTKVNILLSALICSQHVLLEVPDNELLLLSVSAPCPSFDKHYLEGFFTGSMACIAKLDVSLGTARRLLHLLFGWELECRAAQSPMHPWCHKDHIAGMYASRLRDKGLPTPPPLSALKAWRNGSVTTLRPIQKITSSFCLNARRQPRSPLTATYCSMSVSVNSQSSLRNETERQCPSALAFSNGKTRLMLD